MIKLKGVQLENNGPLLHQARYDRKEYAISLPRSQKAFLVHSLVSVIKILIILSSLFLLPFQSIVWRFIAGIWLSWLLAMLVLWITHTRSKSGYFMSYGIMIKVIVWMGSIILISKFDFVKLDILTSGFVRPTIVIMFFIDSFLDQILNSTKIHLFKPLSNNYQVLALYFEKNCRFYLEIPVWTTIYPLIRWIF
jgi:hypothetical protein